MKLGFLGTGKITSSIIEGLLKSKTKFNQIIISNLSKQYSNGVQAIENLDLTIQKGDFYALLGPNGAGKSTTIGILSSLITPTSGSIDIFGLNLKKDKQQVKQLIGIVPQEFNFNI